MSTEVSIIEEEVFLQAMAAVRNDETQTNWALFGHYDGNPNALCLVSQGEGEVEEIQPYLEETQFMYGLARLEETFDMSKTIKLVYIQFKGTGVPFARRGKFGVISGAIEKYFDPYHVTIEVDTADELTTELVRTKLQENSGTRSKVLEATEAKDRPERGFTSGTTTKMDSTGSTPTKRAQLVGIGKGGSSFSGFSGMAKGSSGFAIADELKDAVKDVQKDSTDTKWCAGGYEDGNIKKPLILLGSGDGSLEDLKEFCQDDKVVYGYIRMTDVVDDIATVKFVYIQWVGESVKPMTKAKISTHKGVVEDLFKPFHVNIFATAASELNQRILTDKVSSASGSKKSHVK